ncbi:uncharacterized protein Z520_12242 [Fonsecaea multimorphosa CBS 102226]|uniref:Uncharacterized protein n=1 Tax=Fonsecaea multimorphosa CBS 102226 TaxID=1442371 RepID=A0A0D2JFS9_9EURO|nr:uncharacterized protein Z520_12242 [Fonsecaea multimorphosa CBS 102226]KIX92027.1 hypothetical protein Z520_12242 [Fonsecaea multimorphosa CBS 102226]OAL17395.1 hypothetical protein AYO22_11675 [Fonsecaea multimorphosa]
MNDNSENNPPEGTEQGQGAEETQSAAGGGSGGGSWASKPENLGNKAGEKIENTLSPVGNVMGKGFETIGGPVKGIVDPTVGGLMRAGKGWGDQLGVGYGNHEGGPAKQEEAEGQRMKEPFGGKEQNADNPLGL